MNKGVLHSSPVQPIMAAGNPSRWPCYTNNGIIRAPELVIPSNNSSNFLPPFPFPSSPPCSSGWHDVHNQQEELQQSWTQLLRGGLVGEEDEEEEDEKSGISSSQAKRVKTWQEQVLFEQAQQEHVSPPSNMEFVKQENSTNNYLVYGGHPNDQGAAKLLPASTKDWSSLSSSPKSCITSYGTNSLLNFSTISKSNARHPPPKRSSECNSNGGGGAQKKARLQSSSTQSPFKVRKEKLGDRIAALHQLVSPFGKTDTASVLLEATGYIRFLHSQIEALSLPYMGKNSGDLKHKASNDYNSMKRKGAPNPQVCGEEEEEEIEEEKELRSRGLCLVPISCTVDHQVVNEHYVNGADYWAQACLQSPGQTGGGFC